LAKYAAAFFNISLSTLADASSRRSRSTSASSSFAERGVADPPIDVPNLPARSSLTQLNKLESGILSLRLASDTPNAMAKLDRFDLELIRVPTVRYSYLFVTHTRLQTSSDYKLLMYVDLRQSQYLSTMPGRFLDFASLGKALII
jgi:hypothetical protein